VVVAQVMPPPRADAAHDPPAIAANRPYPTTLIGEPIRSLALYQRGAKRA